MTNCSTVIEIEGGEEEKEEESVELHQATQYMAWLPEDLKEDIDVKLGPLAEQWAGVPLALSSVYGIRRYTRGAWLAAHTDREGAYVRITT